jgi:hypothetical protein
VRHDLRQQLLAWYDPESNPQTTLPKMHLHSPV